jgi:penicillin-binding protein 1C
MLEDGELLPTELVPDLPVRVGGFAPENYTRTYEGAVAAERALSRSLNVPAVHMLKNYGVERFAGLLKALGMTTLHRPPAGYGLTLVLGGAEGRLWDITGMYAGMARCVASYAALDSAPPPFVPPVYGAADPWPTARRNPPLSPVSCYLALKAMLEVARPDEENAWRYFLSSRRIAWKTGTSYGFRDAWAVGVTPCHAVGVWVGNADGEGRPALTGVSCAAPILFDLFGLLDNCEWFEAPESDMRHIEVCAASGLRAGTACARKTMVDVGEAGLRRAACPYCRAVQVDRSRQWRVHASCEPIDRMVDTSWFALPPAMEWYYRKHHADYRPLPPFREDCRVGLESEERPPMALLLPREGSAVYVPRELDGSTGRVVFEAAHREADVAVFWHLDEDYVGVTRDIHQLGLAPAPGTHRLTLVDSDGNRLERVFEVISPERSEGTSPPVASGR